MWNDDTIAVEAILLEINNLSAIITIKDYGTVCCLMVVYGPSRDREKLAFLEELQSPKPPSDDKWLVLGEFNLIYRACDKSNCNINHRRMAQFRDTLNDRKLKEIHLQNRKFRWSNERQNLMLVRLDRFFCNEAGTFTLRITSCTHYPLHFLTTTPSFFRIAVDPENQQPSALKTFG